ncbi:MAG: class I SAM-dependent methyltransferase [Pirellulales bacterium]
MAGIFSDHGIFFREFFRNFHTTGAILPSGRFLAAALARYVGADGPPRRILEVGPGTGAVTRGIIAAMRPEDRLDLVELNDAFVSRLNHRFENDAAFQSVAGRARVLHGMVQDVPADEPYDLVISGLPLNNFSVDDVQTILQALVRLLAPVGTLSFFEYMFVRRVRAVVSRATERARLAGIGQAMDAILAEHEVRRDWIWPNVPPAWVHHVRFGAK